MSALSILAEECELLNDSKYRSYITQVDKALKSFDNTSEWADLISALAKLNKVLLAHVRYPVIPKRVTIGKRLAQCLHPALPSGVHMKALETYDIIFKCIGTERLAQDLFIYSAGLFPLLGYSAMNVKPVLLVIYERHFVGLGKRIKPGLNGLLLGLLPGLEEGSEHYDHTNSLMEDFCECTEPSYFYTCLWECVHSCPGVRLPAVTYLLAHFNKKQTMEDQLHMIGLNISLMIEGICNCVQDSSVLVQRSLLDFLILAFPQHNSQLTRSDMAKIVRAATNVLLRRDMSLNRRFYAWLLGTSPATAAAHAQMVELRSKGDKTLEEAEPELSYFEEFSKELLVQSLKSKLGEKVDLNAPGGKSAVLKPFRILISLLDKPEIGPVILENVLLSIFRCLHREFENSKLYRSSGSRSKRRKDDSADQTSAYDELLKTANLLFGTFEPYFIWNYVDRMFEQTCQNYNKGNSRDRHSSGVARQESLTTRQCSIHEISDSISISELCTLVSFLLEIVSLETFSETQSDHLPSLLCSIISCLTRHCHRLADTDVVVTLRLATNILSKVQPTMTIATSHDMSADTSPDTSPDSSPDGPGGLIDGEIVTGGEVQSSKPLSLEEAVELNKKLKSDAEVVTQQKDSPGSGSSPGDSSLSENQDKAKHTDVKAQNTQASGKHDKTQTSQAPDSRSASKQPDMKLPLSRQASDNSHTLSLSRKSSRSGHSANLMQRCIESFQTFFHTVITQKVFGEDKVARRCFQSLLLTSDFRDSCSTLDRDSCLDSGSEFSYEDRFSESGGCVSIGANITVSHMDDEWMKTFSSACQLLVEFAKFPMYGQDVRKADKHDRGKAFTDLDAMLKIGEGLVPVWVQDLVACCCFVDSYHVQSTAISTMLDLVILTQSLQEQSQVGHQQRQEVGVSVRILPTLHHSDLQVLEEQTNFYKMSAAILWSYLGDTTPLYHQLAVKLFHILHQVSPSSWVCENIIGNQLVTDDEKTRVDAFKKFSVLWHLTRNKKSGIIPGKPLRSFDRSMFVVLDSLQEESSPVRSVAVTWLTHVIRQGDLGRIMEPLLLMLLHPDTARVSIQHVNIHRPRKVRLSESSEDNTEANIYAISSEGGRVIYHVNPARTNNKSQVQSDLKSYALTVLGSRGMQTAPVRARSEQELHFEKVDPNNLSLRINPFGSENSLDKLMYAGYDLTGSQDNVYDRAKRLDKETCRKEGISFVEKDESTQGDETEDELRAINLEGLSDSRSSMNQSCDSLGDSAEDLARNILENVIRRVVPDDPEEPGSLSNSQHEDRKPFLRPVITRTDSLTSSNAGDHDLLNSVTKSGSGIDSPTPSEQNVSIFKDIVQGEDKESTDIHTLHMHMLLYTQKYDYERTLYALSTLKAMLVACPRMTVTALVTTNISSLRATQLAKLQLLLARHRKSVFGKDFFGEIPSDVMSNYRSSMFIEILLALCLYFMRSFYPNLMMSKLADGDLLGNKHVHIMATETLTLMLSEVVDIMRDSGKNFVSYISDLLQRCKVQKALLHCMLGVIYNNRRKKYDEKNNSKITETIVSFNEEDLEPAANEAFQIKLLDILLVMIKLEYQIGKINGNKETGSEADWNRLRIAYQSSLNNVRYHIGHPVVQQGMFVSGVLSALKQHHMCHMHQHWVALVTASLPYMGKHLPGIVMMVVSQLCRNLEALAGEYERDGQAISGKKVLEKIPPDHVVTLLDGLMTLCHYCLLDTVSPVAIGQQSPTGPVAGGQAGVGHTSIISNLFNVFNPVGAGKEAGPKGESGVASPVLEARSSILSILPRITACLTSLWRAINIVEGREESPTLTIGSPKVVRQYILEFLSPISLPHGTHLLGAIAVAWNDRRKKHSNGKNNKRGVPVPCEDQILLVELVEAIKVLPMDTLIQTVKQVLKTPPSSELSRGRKNVPLEVNMLQFFYAYVEKATVSQLVDSWSALLTMLREALQLTLVPPGQFLLLQILNEFIMKTPGMADKKNQRELQEITQRLLEAVSAIAGACLEQTAWLRKNYAVKPGLQSAEETEADDGNQEEEEAVVKERRVVDPEPSNSTSSDSKYSVQALAVLGELTAPMLDVIYSSEEKDKVAPFLTTLLYNVFPYLKSHSSNNLPSLRAASQFLASISSYQYTRKAWRREALELMMDPSFFQMDMTSVTCWLTIVDNLMTHDKTTYKDLMARVSMTQSASLNLFSNKEQEIDQKACMLKRLAFTVFCSELDQYQKNIPEIQEKLAESLRVLQAPSVMAQVFSCFRVLLLRVSPQHLTSMWPTIITELIHVFLQIEQELSTETEEFMAQVQRIAALDSSWAHLGNGLNAHNNPSWLQLYLSACKLLDLCLALPADKVPQFQLYRWAFIGGAAAGEADEDMVEDNEVTKKKKEMHRLKTVFKPHIIRLARLLNTKLQGDVPVMRMTPGRPLLTICHLRSLTELQPFFNTLCLANQADNPILAARQLGPNNNVRNQSVQMTNGHPGPKAANQSDPSQGRFRGMSKSKSAPVIDPSQNVLPDFSSDIQAKTNKQFIEEILKRDFLEPMT